uniref:ZP domain-containing protein n=1 Tax=Parastrongyloides trichosuri TaxID=131310 RepID=A0A0N4ZMQ4_PARTI
MNTGIKIYLILIINIYKIFGNTIPVPKLFDNELVNSNIVDDCISINKVDVMILLETSEFIDKHSFDMMKIFISSLINRFNLSEAGNHLGIVNFSSKVKNIIPLSWDQQKIGKLFDEIKFTGTGKPFLGEALKIVKNTIFSEFTYRESIPKILIVITTGQSYDDISFEVEDLQRENVMIYGIGVTQNTNLDNLYIISNNPSRIFFLSSPVILIDSLVDSVIWDACKTNYRPGTPEIICGKKSIGVRGSTKKNFEGYIYVMDHFSRKECRRNADDLADLKSLSLTIPFNRCNVKRWRSISPRGIHVEVTIIIQYHHLFMTGIDQVIKAKCFYQESPSTIETSTKNTNEVIIKKEELPICTYNLHKNNPLGEIIHVANIGDKVWHVWECKTSHKSDIFGMLVHDCYVDNGRGEIVEIINKDGCSLDTSILDTPIYDNNLLTAIRESEVFKFADKPALQFQCKITLCDKRNGSCAKIIPPKCRNKREVVESNDNIIETFDVITQKMEITIMKNDKLQCSSMNTYVIGFLIILNFILIFILTILCSCRFRLRKNQSI